MSFGEMRERLLIGAFVPYALLNRVGSALRALAHPAFAYGKVSATEIPAGPAFENPARPQIEALPPLVAARDRGKLCARSR